MTISEADLRKEFPNISDDVLRLANLPGKGEIAPGKRVSPSKYKNTPTEFAGMTFSSGHEASVCAGLIQQEKQHLIFGLRLQVEFPLIDGTKYRADAVFAELDEKIGQLIFRIIDAKGYRTREYKRKRRLFKEWYGQDIEEL